MSSNYKKPLYDGLKGDGGFSSSAAKVHETGKFVIGPGNKWIEDSTSRSSVSQSTGRRRERRQKKDNSDWRVPSPSVLQLRILPTNHAGQKLLPHLATHLLMMAKTPGKAQEIIDNLNTKRYTFDDPHQCTPASPCDCYLRRTKNGKPDGTAGLHVIAFDPFIFEFIVPSWHSDLIAKWDLKKRKSYPLCLFDNTILLEQKVREYLKKQRGTLGDGEQLYIIANLFGGDPPNQIKKYDMSIQLIRGNIEPCDAREAGITVKSSKTVPEVLIDAARYGALREMKEETDEVLIGTNHLADMDVVFDFLQCNAKTQIELRGIVFGAMANLPELVNPKKVIAP